MVEQEIKTEAQHSKGTRRAVIGWLGVFRLIVTTNDSLVHEFFRIRSAECVSGGHSYNDAGV